MFDFGCRSEQNAHDIEPDTIERYFGFPRIARCRSRYMVALCRVYSLFRRSEFRAPPGLYFDHYERLPVPCDQIEFAGSVLCAPIAPYDAVSAFLQEPVREIFPVRAPDTFMIGPPQKRPMPEPVAQPP